MQPHISIVLPFSMFFTRERETSGPGKSQFSIGSCDSFIFICTVCCHGILYLYYNCYHLSTFSHSSYTYFSYFYFPLQLLLTLKHIKFSEACTIIKILNCSSSNSRGGLCSCTHCRKYKSKRWKTK